MPLSAIMAICQDSTMQCEIRSKYEFHSTSNQELCTYAAGIQAQRSLVNRGVVGWSHGQCFERRNYAKTVEAAAKSLQDSGYTVSFFYL